MIAIADSGSTKSSWVFVDKGNKKYNYKTVGINPYYQSSEDIYKSLTTELLPAIEFTEKVDVIYFYGAGLELEKQRQEVAIALKKAFPTTEIHVEHDLLAAARAVLGDDEGIACIAGTGSNTCYYDGKEIARNVHSLGLFLGDEGSGGYLGKLIARDYIRQSMPMDIRNKFEQFTPDREEQILDKVYTKPFPNRYLASLAPFIIQNQKDKYAHDLAYENFSLLFDNCVMKYVNHEKVKIHFIGSIASHLIEVLKEVAEDKGLSLGKVIGNPLDALTEYHFKKASQHEHH
jgi:glucosamine kinase